MKHDLMLDIETFGIRHDAVIIQLGACFFNIETGEVLEKFCVNINAETQVFKGATVSQSTLDWWHKQDQNVLKEIMNPANQISDIEAAGKFIEFLGLKGVTETRVWCHTTFDFVLVNNFLERSLGAQFKMPFKNARDIRTLVDLANLDLNKYDWKKKTHNALEDCIFQVEYCSDAYKLLKGKYV